MRKIILAGLLLTSVLAFAGREVKDLKEWQFAKDLYQNIPPDRGWRQVTIPHDWAITGEFDRDNDLQVVAVVQNGENVATAKTGRSGGLPWMGGGWYRTVFSVNGLEAAQPRKGDKGLRGKQYEMVFDGAMANAQVYINGVKAMEWPYGYNSWHFDATPFLKNGENEVVVRLWNEPQSSRWYPGAGLFRNVHVVRTEVTHVPVWGTYITTPYVSQDYALVRVQTSVLNAQGKTVRLKTDIMKGSQVVASQEQTFLRIADDAPAVQAIRVEKPALWSPETPVMYMAKTQVYADDELVDEVQTPMGIRKIEYVPTVGFLLNGEVRKFKGVCLHHDFGALGTAVNTDAIRYQLTLLKDMGCDAIRTTHNMPAPELVQLCDEMGFMLIVESFDMWDLQKTDNDYHKHFNYVETHKTLRNANASYITSPNPNLYTWAERDMINMLHQYRSNPSVMMWSIGNEVWNQTKDDGWKTAKWLQDICHREDPTRPVTCGMDQAPWIFENNFAATLDIPGLNYRTMRYLEGYEKLPQKMILGSETASTVSSRGVYKWPVVIAPDMVYSDNQSSGYDVEYCSWSGLPDQDFALQDDYPWTIGQFVWTGFDYLGEPSPYDTDAWPSHSSYFGIIDLAYLPKDRFYLYRSQWNKEQPTLHALPHWTWTGREGERTPVFVYTSYPEAEVFVNGVSQGRQVFATKEGADTCRTVQVGEFEIASWGSKPEPQLLPRYRLMWHDVVYQPGEMKVFAYKQIGDTVPADSLVYFTAQKPHHLAVKLANKNAIKNPMKGLRYFTISMEDQYGVECPTADQMVEFMVTGDAYIVGAANGDAACLDPLQPVRELRPVKDQLAAAEEIPATKFKMHLFAGLCTVIVQANGPFTLNVMPAKNAQPNGIRSAEWSNQTARKR